MSATRRTSLWTQVALVVGSSRLEAEPPELRSVKVCEEHHAITTLIQIEEP